MAAATAVATRMIRMGASGAVDLGRRAIYALATARGHGHLGRIHRLAAAWIAAPCSVAKAPQRDAFGIEVRVPIGRHCPSRKELEPWRAELPGLASARSAMAANASRGGDAP